MVLCWVRSQHYFNLRQHLLESAYYMLLCVIYHLTLNLPFLQSVLNQFWLNSDLLDQTILYNPVMLKHHVCVSSQWLIFFQFHKRHVVFWTWNRNFTFEKSVKMLWCILPREEVNCLTVSLRLWECSNMLHILGLIVMYWFIFWKLIFQMSMT